MAMVRWLGMPNKREDLLKVGDVMSIGAVTVDLGASMKQAAEIMLQYRADGLPVVDAQELLVGMITEGDFLRRIEIGTATRPLRWSEIIFRSGALAHEFVKSHSRKVEDVMTRNVVSVTNETSLMEAAGLMERHGVKRLPVLREGRVLGMLSRVDFMRAILRYEDEKSDLSLDDQQIRNRIIGALQSQHWAPRVEIHVFVQNGVVELRGSVVDERMKNGIRVLSEQTPGTKEVKNYIDVILPIQDFV